jgi:GT2 family glycosyltransferase
MLKTTGKLDPAFKFWFADNDYSNTLRKHGLKHALVTSSLVDHLESQTLKTKTTTEQMLLTSKERFYYEYKWEGRSFFSYLNRVRKFHKELRKMK